MKSHEKIPVFLVAKTLRDIANHSLKLAEVFSQEPIPFKANTSLYSNPFQYSGAIDACKNIVSVPP